MLRGFNYFQQKRKSQDEVFLTSVDFDSTGKKHLKDSLAEAGNVKTSNDSATGGMAVRFFTDSAEWKQALQLGKPDSATIKGTVTWLARQADSFPGGEESFAIKVKPAPQEAFSSNVVENKSLWSNFWLCLLTGLVAVLTPCVFPLIPVTVSFFLKRSKSRAEGLRNAIWYSLSIILIYTIPTLILTLIFDDKILYNISTSPVSNLLSHCQTVGQIRLMKKQAEAD